MAKFAAGALITALITTPTLAQTPQVSGVGDVIYHADIKAPLPNAWGHPDIFGGKIIVGQIELRYMGLTSTGAAQFQRSDIKIVSDATTMTRGGRGYATSEALPPVLTSLSIDLASDPTVLLNGATIRILAATGSRVTYELEAKSGK